MNSSLVYKSTNNKFMLPVYLLGMLVHIEFLKEWGYIYNLL